MGRFAPDDRSARSNPRWLRVLGWVALVVIVGVAVWYGQRRPAVDIPRTLTIYAFSAMDEVLPEAVLPGFRQHWKQRTGESVEFITTFAGSGAITREILGKIPVEVALLSSEVDASRLAQRGMTAGRVWERLPRVGVVTRSPMVILVRAGNPHGIRSFDDLLRGSAGIVFCDPVTSGAGEWSILSFHAASRRDQSGADASPELGRLRDRIVASEPSARAALNSFAREGKGDALVTYQREWLSLDPAIRDGLEVVYPPTTLISEHVVVRIDKNIDPDKRELVDALVEYLWSPEAQAAFHKYGFVSPDPGVSPAGDFVQLLTLGDLGGAEVVERDVLAPWLREPPAPVDPNR